MNGVDFLEHQQINVCWYIWLSYNLSDVDAESINLLRDNHLKLHLLPASIPSQGININSESNKC